MAVHDDELRDVIELPRTLLELGGELMLLQAGWPSTSFPDGRFWLAVYDGPAEIDWSVGPLSKAVRERASILLFDQTSIPTASPPSQPSGIDIARQVQRDLEFFWAMAPIALKYAGRGHTRNVVNAVGLITPAYHRLWRALHAPDQLGRSVHHENELDEPDFEQHAIRFSHTITLGDALEAVEELVARVAGLHAPLAAAGHPVPDDMVGQVRSLMKIAKAEAAGGGSSPHSHSRR